MGAENAELPLQNIHEDDIDDNDILLGRGGKTNHHPGNATYLEQIKARELEYYYLESRTEKTEYAMDLVQKFRKEGIRFLKKDDKDSKIWHDVGDVKMREKVSQNLREKQPELKRRLAEEAERRRRGVVSPVRSDSNGTANSHQSPRPQPVYPNNHNNNQQMHQNNMQQFLHMREMAERNQEQQQMQAMDHQQQQQQHLMYQQMLQQQQRNGSMGSYDSSGSGGMGGMGYPAVVSSDGGMPFRGGVPIQDNGAAMMMNNNFDQNFGNNDYDSDPLPYDNTRDLVEADLINGMGANDHPLHCSTPPPSDNISDDGGLLSPEEESKLRAAEGNPLPPRRGSRTSRPNMMTVRGRSTDFGLPITDVPGMENFAAMGDSTTSLLDTLEVEPVSEGEEERGDVSPKPTRPTVSPRGGQFTPVLSNRRMHGPHNHHMVPPLTRDNPMGPATVSPTPHGGGGGQQSNVLDDDILQAWANTDGDGFSPFAMPQPVQSAAAPFRRTRTVDGSSPRPTAAPLRRMGTAPAPSPRPSPMTKDKRATSNVAETPETRGNLSPQGLPLSMNDDPSSSHSTSSNFSIKKASLGRDRSEQSRLLKQQCMPKEFAMNSFSGGTTSEGSNSTYSNNNSWMGATGFPNPQQQQGDVPLTPPMMEGGKPTVGQLDREITPRTYAVMQDFGKLTVAHQQSPKRDGAARTATRFEDTIANRTFMEASQSADIDIAMELMVQRPPMMTWRNRTSTIEALDLDPLDDDPVISEDGNGNSRRASRNSISRMWANMPASADFDAFVSNLAGQEVNSLVPDAPPTLENDAKSALSLPNLKA